jgi:uncharacterized membrane protein YhhN
MPLLLLICYFNVLPHSQQDIPSVVKDQCASIASADAWTYGSALASVIISTSAFSSQKLMSGTAFVTLNNINKIPGILVSNRVFGAVLHFPMIVGLSLSLFSGFLFALFSDTKKSLSNFTIFQASLVFFAVANVFLYSGFKFAVLFDLQPLPLELIGSLAPAAIKALPALLMSILVFCSTSNAQSFQRPASYVAIALAFSAFGDFALELPDIAEASESLKSQLFMVGMAFFAVAQWFFITAFSLNNVPRLVSRAVAPYALAFVALFVMRDGIIEKASSDIGLGIGIVIYAMLLAGSAWRACARIHFVPPQTEFNLIMLFKQQIVAAAAFIFMLSDLLIAWSKFHSPAGLGGHALISCHALVMTSYWLAQGLYSSSMFHYESPSSIMRAVGLLLLVAVAAFVTIAYTLYSHRAPAVAAANSNTAAQA